jgi:DNA modification methylase
MILIGDALEKLKTLPDASIHCCVTSPPYWGLRDYGVEGQLGLEKSSEEFVSKMVEVFREVRRVLRDDGTLWLNLGDSYARNGGKSGGKQKRMTKIPPNSGLKEKDLVGIPWRVAFALQADGWYLRQDIIWAKPNPMPESVTDRCTKAHEYIFLLSKSPKYFFAAEAIKEKCAPTTHARIARAKPEHAESQRAHGGYGRGGRSMGPRAAGVNPKAAAAAMTGPRSKQNASFSEACAGAVEFRNKRSVWEVGYEPFSEAHFAVYPTKLIEPCIMAGCPTGGIVLDPFFGAGTTGIVATSLGRQYLGIELNPEYARIAEKRIKNTQPGFTF